MQVVLVGKFAARAHEGADGGRGSVEDVDRVPLDDGPEAAEVGKVGRAFVHERGRTVGERTVNDIGVASDPTDVGGTPVGVALADVEDVFRGDVRADQISAAGVEDALGFSG